MPLDAIGEVLDGPSSIEGLLERHRAYLDRQMVAIRTLREQLASMADASKGDEAVSVTDFLELIRKVITVDDTVKQYFSDEQLADLAVGRSGSWPIWLSGEHSSESRPSPRCRERGQS
ncbi:MAG: hypothetical protein ACYDH5_12050 [Acidimicrobiales bacterium]